MATPTAPRRPHLRIVPSPRHCDDPLCWCGRWSSPELARAGIEVLAFAAAEKARYLEAVAGKVAEKLEPLDAAEAQRVLAELERGDLP
jgi:hypothetical protein